MDGEIMKQILDWKSFLLPYEMAVSGFIMKLRAIKKEYILKGESSPIEIVSGRVKTVPSILEKANRLGIKYVDISNLLYDIAGVRIICKYLEDVYKVYELLKSRKDVEIFMVKDYITNPKPSGYRSLHILAKYRAETIDGAIPINIEFQIRTHAMHLWATIEHSLKYKYYQEIPENIQERLIEASKASMQLDEEMSKIHQAILETKVSKVRGEEWEDDEVDFFLDSFK